MDCRKRRRGSQTDSPTVTSATPASVGTMTKSQLKILACAVLAGAGGCGDSSITVGATELELVRVQGHGQFAPVGQRLPEALVVAVRQIGTQEPVADMVVEFVVLEGDGAELDERLGVTGADGLADSRLRLGPDTGTVRVGARVVDADLDPVEFESFAVEAPTLTGVPAQIRAGEVIELEGSDFNPVPDNNVVLFDGVRGPVTAATRDRLSVRVPGCLLSRQTRVEVRIGSASSGPLNTMLEGSSERLHLEPGQEFVLDGSDGSGCVTLPATDDAADYLLVVQSAGRIAGARYPVGLRGRTARNETAIASGRSKAPVPGEVPQRRGHPRAWWDTHLRTLERELLEDRSMTGTVSTEPSARADATDLAPGDRRTFKVIGSRSDFAEVQATARVVGEHAALYVDDRASGIVSDTWLGRMSALFDDPIHSVVTSIFGEPSDIDGNGRVIILFTPEVNILTDRGDDGFVAGFFFGLDLLAGHENSNASEIFYMLTPDPNGTYSDRRLASTLLRQLPPILAHEFQHMVHFNQRVLLRGGQGTDALWLSEGLATMAEDRFAASAGGPQDFLGTNLDRAARFVDDPAAISLTVTAGSGTLAERGAGWLFTRYLWEHHGGDDALGSLTRTTVTGIDNVEGVTGEDWETLIGDWAVAVQSEFRASWRVHLPERLHYPDLDLETRLAERGKEPPPIEVLSPRDFERTFSLWAGGTAYRLVSMDGTIALALNVGAREGGPLSPESRLQMRIVRVR